MIRNLSYIFLKCRRKWTINCCSSFKGERTSSTRSSNVVENSKRRNRLLLPTVKIHPRKNLFSSMSFNSKNNFSNISDKTVSYFSIPKMNAMSINSFAPPLDPLNLDFCNFIITRSVLKDLASSYNMKNLILQINFQSVYLAQLMLPDGKKEIALT